ncbi:MAG: hypothetical protein FWG38_09400 [Defluviitaleaceae bacterium]|nr:hypothetical protein [Defluviitaleaceae bacterium]
MKADAKYLMVLDQGMTDFIPTYSGVSGFGAELSRSGNTVMVMMHFMTY